MFAFDHSNVSESRIGFRQGTKMDADEFIYGYRE